MAMKSKHTMLLRGFSSSTEDSPLDRNYIDSATTVITNGQQIKDVIEALARQPEFAGVQDKFRLFANDVRHKHYKKYDVCPFFIQLADNKGLIGFCDDLSSLGLTDLSDTIQNQWIPSGVDSIHYTTDNVIYCSKRKCTC